MITTTGEYALRAMARIAQHPARQYALARDLGKELDIPGNYLSKVLQSLARAGLLDSQRGRNGGFRLARAPQDIKLFDILSAVEPMQRYETCILGHKECRDSDACPIHFMWKKARDKVLRLFRTTPLTKLARSRSIPRPMR